MRRAGKTMARRTARTTLQRRPSETWSPTHAAADGDITKLISGARFGRGPKAFCPEAWDQRSPSLDPVTNPEQALIVAKNDASPQMRLAVGQFSGVDGSAAEAAFLRAALRKINSGFFRLG